MQVKGEGGGDSVSHSRRKHIRRIALGGFAAILVAALVLGIVIYDRLQEVDAQDASAFAEKYAEQHRPRGETLEQGGCAIRGPSEDVYACNIRFAPSGSGFLLKLRVVAGGEEFELESAQRKHHLPSKALPPP